MPHNEKFERLAKIAEPLKEETVRKALQKEAVWKDSPFSWLVLHPVAPATKGKLGKHLVAGLCRDCELPAVPHKGKGSDLRVANRLVSVKFALRSEESMYTFEQIRNDGSEFLFCLGVSPSAAHAWVFPMKECFREFAPQHSEESRWVQIRPGNPPEWVLPKSPSALMREQSGKLDEVFDVFRKLLEA